MTYVRRDNKWLLCDDTRVKVVQAVEPLWPSFLFLGKLRRKSKKGCVEPAPVANADLLCRLPQFLQEPCGANRGAWKFVLASRTLCSTNES